VFVVNWNSIGREMMRKFIAGVCCLTFVMACATQTTQARPKYYKYFKEVYPNVENVSTTKCFICHVDKKKKKNNDYGLALKEILKENLGEKGKNVKDVDEIKKALKAAEEKKSKVAGKTFGDLLKENKLPGEDKRE